MSESNAITLTQDRLRHLLNYDQETGIFTWLVKNSNRVFIGKPAWLYIYGKMPDAVIDHINGGRGDNRIENLRDVSIANNLSNQKRPNAVGASGLLGVHLRKDNGKYSAYIKFNRKRTCLGSFKTAEEAGRAYSEARNSIGIPI